MDALNLLNLPSSFHWLNEPRSWELPSKDGLTITAPAKTDWFIDPQGAVNVSNAPALVSPVSASCMLSARVTVDHNATYDAGVLMVYESPSAWAKLCLELSPQNLPTIVSVVTRNVSDDCNSFPVTGPMHLRVSKLEKAYAFHVSKTGREWNLIRYFNLEDSTSTQIGFLAQSPVGDGCTASFSDIRFEEKLLTDIRSGE